MAYEKQTWTTGDVVTAEKLNHIEDGIDGAYLEPEPPTPTPASIQFIAMDEIGEYTFNSIRELINGGTLPILLFIPEENGLVAMPYVYSGYQGEQSVLVVFGVNDETYTANGDTADSPLYFD